MISFFEGIGYSFVDGPEVESEWFNFDVLNMDAAHFARATDHTYYVADSASPGERSGLVLRAHTSPVQARAMLDSRPPLYKVCIGRTYRPDPLDATHSPVFNQLEGLAVDRGLTIDDLKRTLDQLAAAMFGAGIVTRLRPYQFSYAEPAAEIDVQCCICHGRASDCQTCGGEGWIEWGGCGMVHKKVLNNCGVDTTRYNAFSFGMGVERTLMLREGLSDLREIVDGDIGYAQTTRGHVAPEVRSPGLHPLGQAFVNLGYTEITSFPFISPGIVQRLHLPVSDPRAHLLTLIDPLPGQASSLRTTLLPGLLETLQRNAVRGFHGVDIVEQGRVFLPPADASVRVHPTLGYRPSDEALRRLDASLPVQPRHLAAASTRSDDWLHSIDVIGTALLSAGWQIQAARAQHAPWQEGHCMAFHIGDRVVGHAGRLAPDLLTAYGLTTNTCAVEINLDALPPLPLQSH
jgi:phenylalanyl-tRNA synthetase alpha chain